MHKRLISHEKTDKILERQKDRKTERQTDRQTDSIGLTFFP